MYKFPTVLVIVLGIWLKCILGIPLNSSSYRIVGGYNANDGQFPYQISLRLNNSHTCGGSIISRNFILTAAHCVTKKNVKHTKYNPEELSVRVGSADKLQGGIVAQIAEIIVHENYFKINNDVALLRLQKPLIYSERIQPIKLATKEYPVNTTVTISGWGRLEHYGFTPRILQWNTLNLLSDKDCQVHVNHTEHSILCLYHTSNNGACMGDSGGPAAYNNEIIGIAGFVIDECGLNNPDGYTSVLYHANWIREHSDL